MKRALGACLLVAVAGCSAASTSVDDPRSFQPPAPEEPGATQSRAVTRILAPVEDDDERPSAAPAEANGEELGVFKNTYYNFPNERNYKGAQVSLFDSQCRPLARVPVKFHDTLCVQGSGSLETGQTVSFARRNCTCARTCPRTGQKICFEALDHDAFPWGRGSAGTAIVPLRSVAVDISVIPLGTSIYIPEYAGLPRDLDGTATHDGCFVAEDRGIKVVGNHVDIFTGDVALFRLWDELVPTYQGVSVFINSPRCPSTN